MYTFILTLAVTLLPQTIDDLNHEKYKVREAAVHSILSIERSEDLLNNLVEEYHKVSDIEQKLNLHYCLKVIYYDLYISTATEYVYPCHRCGECNSCYYSDKADTHIQKRLDEMYSEFKTRNKIRTVLK